MTDEVMEGQLSVFDILAEEAEKKPCEYRFQRYIGQHVSINGVEGVVVKIEPYYTEVETKGRFMIGTPSTMVEVKSDPVKQVPIAFAEYVGVCEYCYWYKYGLHRTEKDKYICEWDKHTAPAFDCRNKSRWCPDVRKIPKLCGNCRWSNCFHYEEETRAGGGYTKRGPIKYPKETEDIYCTREDGPVNRSRPYEEYSESTSQLNTWDFVHEFDTCEAWAKDASILDGRPLREQ